MECPVPECKQRQPTELGRKLTRLRPWVQTGFLGMWLAPLGQWLHGIPSCVFHCYSCPLSSFGCPVGIAANYAALLPVTLEIPYLLLGILSLVGALGGSIVCGWACPFGFLQDLLGRVTVKKVALPGWLGYTRFVVLVGLVLLLPMILGYRGIPFEDQVISICRLCPAGALEAGLPYSAGSLLAGKGWLMSWFKTGILVAFIASALFIHRPWCRIFCPLGGLLALFNRFSLFHLRFNAKECIECNLCRSRCHMGVKVDQHVNVSGCIRCLECTTCGALEPCFALPKDTATPPQPHPPTV
jgi:ferredoxin-type protein NapH